ncbi:MAG: hypothetical protein P8179_06495 [Candidatus Thiodiazotropha sp.]|jgi:hypothetical protein
MKKQFQSTMVLGVTWYTADAWVKVKSTAVDPDRFEETFKEWEVIANKALEDLKKSGVNPRKVLIDPSQFAAWCMLCNKENSASSRAEYVQQRLQISSA